MKKVIVLLVLALAVTTTTGKSTSFAADDVITDTQITAIRTHCSEIQTTLVRLRQADTLLRYDRGQLYRTLADKLMAPFNQRAASNQLDVSQLVTTTVNYNDAYQVFFDAYRDYDTALSGAIMTDCVKQPTIFFDKVNDARTKRIALSTSNKAIVKIAGDYKAQFDTFRTKFTQQEKGL